MFKSLFLPVGLIVAMALGVLIPSVGSSLAMVSIRGWQLKDLTFILIFLVTGAGLRLTDFHPEPRLLKAIGTGMLINLGLAPLLALGVVLLAPLSIGAAAGLIIMCCVPTTLSSAIVITRSVRGATAWSVMMMLSMTLVGTALLPFSLRVFLGATGQIELDVVALLITLGTLVGVPLVIGMALRTPIKALSIPGLDYVPTACVLIVVFLTMSANAEAVRGLSFATMVGYFFLTMALHLVLFWVAALAGRWQRLRWQERIALAMAASQKTLPLALTAIVAVSASLGTAGQVGLAVMMCVIFHLQQILIDSVIAGFVVRRWRRHKIRRRFGSHHRLV